jgi:pimeloyl-ACP methyl ester carboxylesterase
MTITSADVLNASILSNAAYQNSAGLVSYLNGSIWEPIGPGPVASGLPRPSSLPIFEIWNTYFGEGFGDSNFLFDNGNVQAFAARNIADNSIAISFRGTSGVSDLIQDIYHGKSSFRPEYDQFKYFVQSVDQYISENKISKVLVTGHSLGGAMAESYMLDHQSSTVNYVGVTFGSPGDPTFSGRNDPRLINLGHSQDPVFDSAEGG